VILLIVGVFSPVINLCGGAEWVAVNMINVLKENGHQVVILTDSPLNQSRFEKIFDRQVQVDRQVIFPFRHFVSNDLKNVYTDAIRIQALKTKCNVIIDTFSNAILPAANIAYIHHPLLTRIDTIAPYWSARQRTLNRAYFLPYHSYLKLFRNNYGKLIFANSKFTAQAIKAETGLDSSVLYPSVSNDISNYNQASFDRERDNTVTTISRIDFAKNLNIIPKIAKLTSDKITFNIVGLLDSQAALASLLRQTKDLGVSNRVKIYTNVRREQIRDMLLNTRVYLHTKMKEHFGISIVEAMTSGCIPVVHNSGGPMEFVPQNRRYLSIEEAAIKVEQAINDWSQKNARTISESADKFSEKNFSRRFIKLFNSYCDKDLGAR
jgi:alpha-1,2-mannosyltransferase